MQYNLGNYGNNLTLDDYNAALRAGGSSYQFGQQQQAPSTQGSGIQNTQSALQTANNVQALAQSGQKKDDKEEGGLNKILGLVGSVLAFI